jgi:hypothetical protein
MGIGGFGSDGVFQDAGRKLSTGEVKIDKNHNDLLDRSIESSGSKAPFSKVFHAGNSQELESIQRINHLDLSNQKMVQDNTPLVLHDARPDMYSRGAQMMPRVPPFNFTPQSWMYRDPSGILQGPFSSQQMQDWYTEGFFPPDLPIKHVDDPGFISISALVSRFGSKAPFLAELEESHAMARILYERRVAAMVMNTQPQDPLRFGGGFAGNTAVTKPDSSSGAWGMPSLRPTWDESRHNESMRGTVAPPHRPEPIPIAVSRPEVDSVPSKMQNGALEQKLEGLHVSPISQAVPPKSTKSVDPMALPPKPKPLSPVSTDKKRVEKPTTSEDASPIKSSPTTMAPWAKANVAPGPTPGSKIKMKDIQDKEEIRRYQSEQERQKKADESVLAQAAAILKAEAHGSAIVKPTEGHAWGSKSSKPAALKFSEILVEENLQKSNIVEYQGDSNVAVGGAKRYADLVNNSPSVSHVNKAARPHALTQVKNVVASKEVIPSSGWQTVGKGGHVTIESR